MHEHNILLTTNIRGYFCLVSPDNENFEQELRYEQKVEKLTRNDFLWEKIVEGAKILRKDFFLTEKGDCYIFQANLIGLPNLYRLTDEEWCYLEGRTLLKQEFIVDEEKQ